jgi:hypothetical protein
MIKKFTYKELTLILGIIVALIVVFTMWLRQPLPAFSSVRLPKLSSFVAVQGKAIRQSFSVFGELPLDQNNLY